MSTTTTANKASVLYDGHCAFCQKSVNLLKRLDWLGKLSYVDVRHEEQMKAINVEVNPDRVLEEMHVVTPQDRRLYHGFGAIRWMAWRLPLLWPVAPLMYVPGVPFLGQKLYLWIARNRFDLVPCHGGVCTLPQQKKQSTEEK